MGFIADEFSSVPRGAGEDRGAVPINAPPPSRDAVSRDAVEGAIKVFLGQLRALEGPNVKLYRHLSPKERKTLHAAMSECIRVYLRLARAIEKKR